MVTNSYSKWGVRLGTLAIWVAAGASVAYWGLRLSNRPVAQTVPAVASMAPVPDAQAVARVLGALPAGAVATVAAPVASLASRFALMGVLSGRQSGGGAALIAVDGKPAKTFRVGTVVDSGMVLQSLGPRQAQLGADVGGPAMLMLDMPRKN